MTGGRNWRTKTSTSRSKVEDNSGQVGSYAVADIVCDNYLCWIWELQHWQENEIIKIMKRWKSNKNLSCVLIQSQVKVFVESFCWEYRRMILLLLRKEGTPVPVCSALEVASNKAIPLSVGQCPPIQWGVSSCWKSLSLWKFHHRLVKWHWTRNRAARYLIVLQVLQSIDECGSPPYGDHTYIL